MSCDLLYDFAYYSLSYSLIGSIMAYAMSTNSLSSALSSCDICLIKSVTLLKDILKAVKTIDTSKVTKL